MQGLCLLSCLDYFEFWGNTLLISGTANVHLIHLLIDGIST